MPQRTHYSQQRTGAESLSTTTDRKVVSCSEVIEREIERARVELRPISRRALRDLVIKELSISSKEAELAVDQYCEEKAPYTPDYLSNEFLLPYIKFVGLVFVIGSLVLIGLGAERWQSHRPSWVFFISGAVLFGLSAIGLMKAIHYEQQMK